MSKKVALSKKLKSGEEGEEAVTYFHNIKVLNEEIFDEMALQANIIMLWQQNN